MTRCLIVALLLGAAPAAAQGITLGRYSATTTDGPRMTIVFTAQGADTFLVNGEVRASGTYTVHGDTLDLVGRRGVAACDDPGHYVWKLEGKTLTFGVIADNCFGRLNSLTSQSWIREEP